MVASDTIVGIVGSVLLVVVMAGVFVYEYNNQPDDGDDGNGDGSSGSIAHFQDDYPSLAAREDLDGDGKANYEDDDIDGDGVKNDADEATKVVTAFSGSTALQVAPNSAGLLPEQFFVGTGAAHVMAYVNYSVLLPSPVPTNPVISATLKDAGGDTIANGVATTTGTSVTVKIMAEGDLTPGTYTIDLQVSGATTNTAYSGVIMVHYDVPAGGGHSH